MCFFTTHFTVSRKGSSLKSKQMLPLLYSMLPLLLPGSPKPFSVCPSVSLADGEVEAGGRGGGQALGRLGPRASLRSARPLHSGDFAARQTLPGLEAPWSSPGLHGRDLLSTPLACPTSVERLGCSMWAWQTGWQRKAPTPWFRLGARWAASSMASTEWPCEHRLGSRGIPAQPYPSGAAGSHHTAWAQVGPVSRSRLGCLGLGAWERVGLRGEGRA